MFREGLTDSYQSTGTLNRILQSVEQDNHEDSSDYDSEGDIIMKNEEPSSKSSKDINGKDSNKS